QAAAAAASNRNILAAAAATLPSVIDNGQFFHSLLANVRLLEQKMCAIEKQQRDEATSSAFVDVCSIDHTLNCGGDSLKQLARYLNVVEKNQENDKKHSEANSWQWI
uniref:Uncharacterized protein n=1 Tax=Parascaris equorum TaxID=6256 RepID=A0A914R9D3_PAREQ